MTVTNVELQSQIIRLDEKVDDRHENNQKLLSDLVTKMDTLIELNLGQKLQAQLIGQISERVKEQDKCLVEIFGRMAKVESTTGWHGMVWKAVGVVLITSIGGIGWLLVQMKDYYHLEYRVDTLEFLVQGRTTPVLPPAQTSSGSK
jgi:hypothetical protein